MLFTQPTSPLMCWGLWVFLTPPPCAVCTHLSMSMGDITYIQELSKQGLNICLSMLYLACPVSPRCV